MTFHHCRYGACAFIGYGFSFWKNIYSRSVKTVFNSIEGPSGWSKTETAFKSSFREVHIFHISVKSCHIAIPWLCWNNASERHPGENQPRETEARLLAVELLAYCHQINVKVERGLTLGPTHLICCLYPQQELQFLWRSSSSSRGSAESSHESLHPGRNTSFIIAVVSQLEDPAVSASSSVVSVGSSSPPDSFHESSQSEGSSCLTNQDTCLITIIKMRVVYNLYFHVSISCLFASIWPTKLKVHKQKAWLFWSLPAPLVAVICQTCWWSFVGNQARYDPSSFSVVWRQNLCISKYPPRQEENMFQSQYCKPVFFQTRSPTGIVSPQRAPTGPDSSPGNNE